MTSVTVLEKKNPSAIPGISHVDWSTEKMRYNDRVTSASSVTPLHTHTHTHAHTHTHLWTVEIKTRFRIVKEAGVLEIQQTCTDVVKKKKRV